VMGLLFVAWGLSIGRVWIFSPPTSSNVILVLSTARFCVGTTPGLPPRPTWFSHKEFLDKDLKTYLGWFWFYASKKRMDVFIPIPPLITMVLPFAIGPFISFRFRICHYLAYTALVAVELAYYLRWQE
jgi:hypothetical protein